MSTATLLPGTRYAISGDASIAYQVAGDGPLDLLFLPGWISQIEHLWQAPPLRRFLERMALFSRLILFDRRGSGLSDRIGTDQTLGQDALDALAVLDAAGSERAALFAYGLGSFVAARLAARHADRVGALIMFSAVARTSWAPDHEWALRPEDRVAMRERNLEQWGKTDRSTLAALAPSLADDAAMLDWFARMQRLAASPKEARAILTAIDDQDVREELPLIGVPTLVLHRDRDTSWDPRHSRYVAERIPGARYVELPGIDSLPFAGDFEPILEEVEGFLTGQRRGGRLVRALMTVMFTDIVDATGRAARLGDSRWRDLLAIHDDQVRGQLTTYGGREIKTVGDGFLAVFEGPPSRALRCSLAIQRAAREVGLELRIGVHTGECEVIGDDVGGMAVHIAARICGLAGPGEVLASGTAYGTVVGGPFRFSDRGAHELRGVPGRWPVFQLGV